MTRRFFAVLGVAALLIAGAVLDREARPDGPPPAEELVMPIAPRADALSSSWYCAGGTAIDKGLANASVVIANPGTEQISGRVRLVPADLAAVPVDVPFTVAASAREVIPYLDHITAEWVSALVEINNGTAAVEHTVSGPLGADVAPCSPAGSDHWYLADGSTTVDARELLFLFNPFPEDAIVDLSFSTEDGRVAPPALQAVVVPGGRLVPIGLNDHVIRRKAVSASIVARAGRVVVDKIQTFDGSAGRKGLALMQAAPSAGTLWQFPEGYWGPGVTERYQFYNPTRRDAVVTVELSLEEGSTEPVEVAVPGFGRASLRLGEEQGVPSGVAHAAVVQSTNDVDIVVERTIDATAPSERLGLAATMGSRLTARRWVFPSGLTNDRVDEWIILFNSGTKATKVTFTALAAGQQLAIADLQGVPLEAGRRKAIRIGDFIRRDDLALLVTSTQPIVAERTLYRVKALGISAVIGIPLRD